MDFGATHKFLANYLRYVENTESPKLMHIWSALSGLSACMGRRCWLPMETGEIFPNMYVFLTGPAAVRKSTAFKIMSKFLRNNTNVRFAPDDTGGQRQGLISAMTDLSEEGENDEDAEIIKRLSASSEAVKESGNYTTLADLENNLAALGTIRFDTRDPRTMYVAASELNSFLGEGNTALLTFLIKMWDGDPYDYRLKNSSNILKDALIGLIGATTPAQIALSMPAEAVGQGFTSRVIFVYADRKSSRKIPRPTLNKEIENDIAGVYARISNDFNGPFIESPAAAVLFDKLYERGTVIKDPRFVHYAERRPTHLQKLCMALAASRGSQTIEDVDVQFGDQLLLLTEEAMPEALGEYGMNKLGAAKQRLMDFLKNSDGPIPTQVLYGMLARDMSHMDFKNTITELHNAKKLSVTTLPVIGQCIIAVADTEARKARKEISELERLMAKA